MRVIVALVVAFTMSSCAVTLVPYYTANFEPGARMEATVGSVILRWETGRKMAGVSHDAIAYELLYSGSSKDQFVLTYREYGMASSGSYYARPAFSQQLIYDRTSSDTIAFQDLLLSVESATSRSISVTVLSQGPDRRVNTRISTGEPMPRPEDPGAITDYAKPYDAVIQFVNRNSMKVRMLGESATHYKYSDGGKSGAYIVTNKSRIVSITKPGEQPK